MSLLVCMGRIEINRSQYCQLSVFWRAYKLGTRIVAILIHESLGHVKT